MSNISLNIYWFWSPLSPVLFNVCTKGLADLNQNGPSKFLTLVDDGLIYKTSKDSQEATEAVQQQLDSVSQWCHDTGSLNSPGKAQTLCCTLDNRTDDKPAPAVTLDGAVVERTSHLRYLGIHFDRMLTYRKHVETTAPKCKKGLSVLKAMAAKGIGQRHLFLLYQSVVLSVIDYGLGLTTMAQTYLLKLDKCRTRQCESYLEPPRTHPFRLWGSC